MVSCLKCIRNSISTYFEAKRSQLMSSYKNPIFFPFWPLVPRVGVYKCLHSFQPPVSKVSQLANQRLHVSQQVKEVCNIEFIHLLAGGTILWDFKTVGLIILLNIRWGMVLLMRQLWGTRGAIGHRN